LWGGAVADRSSGAEALVPGVVGYAGAWVRSPAASFGVLPGHDPTARPVRRSEPRAASHTRRALRPRETGRCEGSVSGRV